jgi:hypothetical protein
VVNLPVGLGNRKKGRIELFIFLQNSKKTAIFIGLGINIT